MAFSQKKTEKLWVWRAYDPVARRTIAWVLGGRDDATPAFALGSVHIFVPFPVMPVKAGTQGPHIRLLAGVPLGPRFRGDDE